ncbi:MAG: PKD domain-containing protein [Cytophagales bacterium]|nr:PKD domain-containing protein [Cytophagales bacterium]
MRTLLSTLITVISISCLGQLPELPDFYIEKCGVLKVEGEVKLNESYLYRWRLPNDELIYGETIHHCFEDTDKQELLLEWVHFSDQETILGRKPVTVILPRLFELGRSIYQQEGRYIMASPQFIYKDEPDSVSYTWSTGDGQYIEGKAFNHNYQQAGSYTVQVVAKIKYQDRVIMLSSKSDIKVD